jgi:hypothetical protein
MIGIAPPVPPADASVGTATLQSGAQSVSNTVRLDGPADVPGKKTMLGIARPGIAPLNPGIEKPRPPAALPPPPPPVPPEPPLAQPWRPGPASTPAPVSKAVPHPLRIPAGAAVAIVGAAALLAAAGVALFLFHARGTVEATLETSSDGRDRLELVCKGCADGSAVHVGNARGVFHSGKAEVVLEQTLAVGNNKVGAELERRPGHSDHVELSVPVDFRVRADTAGLAQAQPHLVVRVEAVPHTVVVVEGRPITLAAGPGGTESGSAELEVTQKLTGNSSVVAMLDQKIPYVVTPPNGTPASGELSVRIGVTPLVLQAPGPSIVIESATFVLAGHTAKDASVSVEGRPITVDGTGAFAQMMSVSSLGETNISVRADAKDQAPRLVPIRVRRVENLATEATSLRANATSDYSALERDPDGERGLAVALDGSVVETRVDAFTTVLLFDVKSGCNHPPCLARVSIGEKTPLREGTSVSVFGAVTGSVEGPHQGTRIPAIAADFVLKGRP